MAELLTLAITNIRKDLFNVVNVVTTGVRVKILRQGHPATYMICQRDMDRLEAAEEHMRTLSRLVREQRERITYLEDELGSNAGEEPGA